MYELDRLYGRIGDYRVTTYDKNGAEVHVRNAIGILCKYNSKTYLVKSDGSTTAIDDVSVFGYVNRITDYKVRQMAPELREQFEKVYKCSTVLEAELKHLNDLQLEIEVIRENLFSNVAKLGELSESSEDMYKAESNKKNINTNINTNREPIENAEMPSFDTVVQSLHTIKEKLLYKTLCKKMCKEPKITSGNLGQDAKGFRILLDFSSVVHDDASSLSFIQKQQTTRGERCIIQKGGTATKQYMECLKMYREALPICVLAQTFKGTSLYTDKLVVEKGALLYKTTWVFIIRSTQELQELIAMCKSSD